MTFTYTLNDIEKTAQELLTFAKSKKVWAMQGEMGAGKTTFIHAICKISGVTSAVGSPTYAIINEYKGDEGTIYHMDWYRLKDEEEALQAGVEDCILSGQLCLIEWPEKALSLLPKDCFHVNISVIDEKTRNIAVIDI